VIVALVDASNVRRSTWPNIAAEELPMLVGRWAEDEGVQAVLVFDGPSPQVEDAGPVELVSTAAESADDWIARRASELRARPDERFWLVTSDRGLRARAASGAERTIGGGTFARALLALRS
jgi:hypothetical protein